MDHILCLNTNSFPAESAEQASVLFEDALQGVLELNSGGDRYTMYLDSIQQSDLDGFLLAKSFTFSDYKEQLLINQDMDLYLFLLELEDKSPALDYLEQEILDDIFNYSFYMPSQPSLDFPDVLSLAYFLNANLLSINTSEQWKHEQIHISRVTDNGQFIDERLILNHISKAEHGKILYESLQHVDLRDVSESNVLSDEFLAWYEELSIENKSRASEKYKLACERCFDGGEPLFKTLTDGLREIRFSAYPGGAIRILFKRLKGGNQAILVGFIKKSNTAGYDENMPKALEIFDKLN